LKVLGERRWGTRPGAPGLRGLGWFTAEVNEGRASDYVLAGVEDVAGGLPTVCYYLVYGRLALFVQAAVADAPERLALARIVQGEAIEAAAHGRLPAEGQLVVIDTPFGNHHWEWTPHVFGDSDGMEGARQWLAGLPSEGSAPTEA
jgi:hypothetical protein